MYTVLSEMSEDDKWVFAFLAGIMTLVQFLMWTLFADQTPRNNCVSTLSVFFRSCGWSNFPRWIQAVAQGRLKGAHPNSTVQFLKGEESLFLSSLLWIIFCCSEVKGAHRPLCDALTSFWTLKCTTTVVYFSCINLFHGWGGFKKLG